MHLQDTMVMETVRRLRGQLLLSSSLHWGLGSIAAFP
jgi:hypothetical protein